MDETKNLRKLIAKSFKLNGLSIKGDACEYLCKQLYPVPENVRQGWLSKITDFLQQKQSLTEPVIHLTHITAAVQECCKSELNLCDDIVQVISAFEVPKFDYNPDLKKFLKCQDDNTLFDWAGGRTTLFQRRYTVLKQKLDRHDLLMRSDKSMKLKYIDHLLSNSDEDLDAVILGMISQLKEGKYYIEDTTGVVPVDLSNTTYHPGFFTENCFVLAEGTYTDGVFRIQGLAHPPVEPSKVSRTYFGNANTFGGSLETSAKNSSRMVRYEQENEEAMIVFLADIFLDQTKTFQKLEQLFSGFDDDTPAIIVLMGNFLSGPQSYRYFLLLEEKFKELADTVSKNSNLVRDTLFVIIPGPADNFGPNILPMFPMPTNISEEFKKKVPKSIFATNPCRIQYCTQELVILRENILSKMCRNCIHYPGNVNVPAHFSRTILSQSHMAPLPLSVCPIHWNFDECMHLYPMPDLVVVADEINDFVQTYKDTIVMNPGSFSKKKFIFKVYLPGKKQVEDSQIPDV